MGVLRGTLGNNGGSESAVLSPELGLVCGDDIEEWVYVVEDERRGMKWVVERNRLPHTANLSVSRQRHPRGHTTLNGQLSAATS